MPPSAAVADRRVMHILSPVIAIAATAIENSQLLVSSNAKHYRPIKDLDFRRFAP